MSDQGIRAVDLPEPLVGMLAQAGFTVPVLQASDVAISLSVSVAPHRVESDAAAAFRHLAQAALSVRQAALQVGLDLPLVVVLDVGLGEEETPYESFRRTFDSWAGEQDWHRGDFALYLCPPVNPLEEGRAKWTGPRNREEMVQHLLGRGTADWGLIPSQPRTEVGVAGQLEAWAIEHGVDRSDLHGDLVLTAASALRDLDRTRTGTARKAAEDEAQEAISAWVARNLSTVADSASEERA